MKSTLWAGGGLVLVAGLWLLLSAWFGAALVPPPSVVLPKAAGFLLTAELWGNLAVTLARTLAGFAGAALLGFGLGLWMGRSAQANAALFLPSVLLQAAPPILWIIPLILILGTEGWSSLAVVFLVVLPLAIFAVRDSRRVIPAWLWDVFRLYGSRPGLRLRELLLPQLAPALRSVLTLGLVLALKSTVLGEWFGAKDGLGRLINQYYYVFDMPAFYALALIFLLVAWGTAAVSVLVAQRWFPLRQPSPPWLPLPPNQVSVPQTAAGRGFELQAVDFGFGRQMLFQGLSLRVGPGEVLVLSGDSGTGKTTLARLALGLLRPQAGQVKLATRPAYIFQEDGLLAHRDCLGNALLPAWNRRQTGAEGLALAALQTVGLAGEEAKFPDELSGGMKKRLSLARALVLDPDSLILDEPFHNLQPAARTELWDLTWRLFVDRGLPTIIITHYPEELRHRPGLRRVSLADLPGAVFRGR